MSDRPGDLDVVTGAFGYTGRYLTRRLRSAGRRVRTLTAHPRPHDPAGGPPIEIHPYHFDDPDALVGSLRGADTLFNTYWVRYTHAGTSYPEAVRNSRRLIEAAVEAGVRRLVHISITKPQHDSFYAYYRGKAEVEDAVRASGLSYAIVRPTVLFGGDDILINNIAWLVRRFRVFAIPGDGRYRLRPVATADLADLAVRLAASPVDVTVDAVGPQSFAFEDLVAAVAGAVGVRYRAVHVPPAAVSLVLPLLGLLAHDVVLTSDELRGLMAEYVHVDGEATCPTRLTDYLAARGRELGATYQSELARRRPPIPAAG
ncbi:MAG TPA: NAD(P)H-binding protein [Kineosporiaceae bacterium]